MEEECREIETMKMYNQDKQGMYSPVAGQDAPKKNPNRVAGGLRAQGADTIAVYDEYGNMLHVPSEKFVKSLEDRIRNQQIEIRNLNKKYTKLQRMVEQTERAVNNMRRR